MRWMRQAMKRWQRSSFQRSRLRPHPVAAQSPVSPVVDDSPVTEPTEDGVRLQVDASMTTIETQEDGTVMEVVKLDSTTLGKVVEELIHSGKSSIDGASG